MRPLIVGDAVRGVDRVFDCNKGETFLRAAASSSFKTSIRGAEAALGATKPP